MGLVYSTEFGRMCPVCAQPVDKCTCGQEKTSFGDGIVRVRREVKKRGGKTVTVIQGCPLDASALKDLASELKRRTGTGGAIKDGNIEIQGDVRALVVGELEKRGFKVKMAGG